MSLPERQSAICPTLGAIGAGRHGLEHAGQIGRKLCGNLHPAAERDALQVQERAIQPEAVPEEGVRIHVAVARVSEQWMAEPREVALDLLRTLLFDLELEQRVPGDQPAALVARGRRELARA